MREILYNPDNLKKEDIDEVVVRVKALIINSNNEITLGYAHKTYQFPGGHLESGETLEEGLIREIKEETGIELNIKIPSPFQKTTYYTKNYRDSGLNRENDIYYYIIKIDQAFDMSNTNLDQHEIDGNYTCVTIPLDDFERILNNSINDNPQNKVIVSEMLEAFNEYKRINENKMEYWDLYDRDKNMLERKAIRGEKLAEEEFHLVVNAWVKNDDGKFLISQRSPNKKHPLIWEVTGGSALMGEDGIAAAIRELKEELNFDVTRDEGKYLGSTLRFYPNCNDILEVWLFTTNNKNQEIKIQEEEVNDYKWATKEEILALKDKNLFDVNAYFDEVLK